MEILNYIVGYRSRTKWKMIVATLYYVCSLFNSIGAGKAFLPNLIILVALPFVVISLAEIKKSKKNLIVFFGGILLMAISAGFMPGVEVEKITLTNDLIFMSEEGVKETISYEVQPSDATEKRIVFVSGDESVAKIDNEEVVAVSDGQTYIYAQTEDGEIKSNKVKVSVKTKTEKKVKLQNEEIEEEKTKSDTEDENKDVSDKAKDNEDKSDDAPKAVEDTSKKENSAADVTPTREDTAEKLVSQPNEDATPAVSKSSQQTTSGSNQSSASSATAPVTVAPAGSGDTIVYITNTGTKYHNAGCRTLKSKIETTLANAQSSGYAPCGVCH